SVSCRFWRRPFDVLVERGYATGRIDPQTRLQVTTLIHSPEKRRQIDAILGHNPRKHRVRGGCPPRREDSREYEQIQRGDDKGRRTARRGGSARFLEGSAHRVLG